MSDTAHGRRLRCDGCRERVPDADAWDHYRDCRAPLSYPYRPDRVRAGEQTDLTEFGT